MSISKLEIQRLMERIGRLENQVASLNFKMQAFENLLKPENLAKRVRDGEKEEQRKIDTQLQVSTDLFKSQPEQ